jgi:hypothetical protein
MQNLKGDKFDGEMGEFLYRRESILASLKHRTGHDPISNPKYSHVEAKLYQPSAKRTSYEKVPSTRQSKTQTVRLASTHDLLQNCEQEMKTEQFKTIHPETNIY